MIGVSVRSGRWADSAKMMAAARAAESAEGVERAFCFMGTPANRQEAGGLGLDDPAIDAAGPDDLVIAVLGDDPDAGLSAAAEVLDRVPSGAGPGTAAARPLRSLARAEADVAVISVPGEYAALEAHKALGAGMDVLLFSDGVPIEDEVALKRRAHDLGLLVMGPGAGTAIIDGLALGFANVVARGSVGVVAAAGTGAQEVTVLVDRAGAGVSRCYGTGGRDLKDDVGAITALDAIARLDADDDTDVILCVSVRGGGDRAARAGVLRGADRRLHGGRRRGPRRGRPPRRHAGGGRPGGGAPRRAPDGAASRAARRVGDPGVRPRALLGRHPLQRGGGDPGRPARHGAHQRPRGRRPAARRRPHRPRLPRPRRGGVHPRPPAPDDRPRRPRGAPRRGGRRPGGRRAADRRGAGLRQPSGPCERAGAGDPSGDGRAAPARRGRVRARPQVLSRQSTALADAGVRLAPTNAAAARLAAALCG